MKIITVITQMEGGGAQNAAVRMAQELRKRGHTTETCFLYMRRPAYLGYDHVRVIKDSPVTNPFDYLKIFIRFLAYIREEKPDAIIGFTYYANIFGALAGLLAGVPLRVASQRNPSWSYPQAGRIGDRIIGSLGAYTSNIAVSHSVRESFLHYPASYLGKMVVIYNGIPHRSATLSPFQARARYGIPEGRKVIVTTGRLSQQKNQEVLLRAVAGLNGVHLAIAGDGELREELTGLVQEMKLQDRVTFVGELPAEEVPDFLKVGDIFVFPSRFEAFGFSVMEAALAGMPLLVSDIPPLREILGEWQGEGAAAIFLPLDDAGKWKEAIEQLFDDPAALAAYSSAARKRSEHFKLDRMADGYEALIRN